MGSLLSCPVILLYMELCAVRRHVTPAQSDQMGRWGVNGSFATTDAGRGRLKPGALTARRSCG